MTWLWICVVCAVLSAVNTGLFVASGSPWSAGSAVLLALLYFLNLEVRVRR